MTIEYRDDYFENPEAKATFEHYAMEIFGLDFSRWKDRGLWDDKYTPFSAFIDGVCVASICVYPSKMKIDGKERKGAQLLTVGTLPEYRLQGIQRQLWERAKAWIRREDCDFVFLFTDESAAGFYEKLGLRRQPEFSEIIHLPQSARHVNPRFRKLDLEQDRDFAVIERLAKEREMVSDRLGFHNPNLLLFMFLYLYRDCSYYLEDLDAVVVLEEKSDCLRIHDIVARKTPNLKELMAFLGRFDRNKIEFLFCTDRIGTSKVSKKEIVESLLFVSKDFNLDGTFVFPSSIRA